MASTKSRLKHGLTTSCGAWTRRRHAPALGPPCKVMSAFMPAPPPNPKEHNNFTLPRGQQVACGPPHPTMYGDSRGRKRGVAKHHTVRARSTGVSTPARCVQCVYITSTIHGGKAPYRARSTGGRTGTRCGLQRSPSHPTATHQHVRRAGSGRIRSGAQYATRRNVPQKGFLLLGTLV